MIRRILDFVFILLFIWACMILGLWIIDSFIVPPPGVTDDPLIATLKVVISASMVLFWLWLWREIVKRMFWQTLRRNKAL